MILATSRVNSGRGVELLPQSVGVHSLAAEVRAALPSADGVRLVDGTVRVTVPQAMWLFYNKTPAIEWGRDVVRYMENRTKSNDRLDVEEAKRIFDLPIDAVRGLIAECRLLRLLDDHQVRNVAMMTIANSTGACVFDEQGTGKTISVVAAFDLLVERNEAEVLLVVAPKSMVGEWKVEIDRFTDHAYKVELLDGSRSDKARSLSTGADVYICNYETLAAIPDNLRLLCEQSRVIIAADESFNVKNPEAGRTQALARVREWCVRAFVLCGTPAPNDASDVIAQVSLVDLGRAFGDVRLPGDPDEARDQIRDVVQNDVVYSRNLKSIVLPSLPGRTFTEVRVTMGTAQRELYVEVAGSLATELNQISDKQFRADYSSYFARRAALLRICSDPSAADPSIQESPGKLIALDALLGKWINRGEKVVVWSFYRSTLDGLAARYAHYGLVRVDGSIGDVADRRAAVDAFQNDPDTRIFLGNPAAAGAGITLHSAAISVYESMSNQAAHYLQSLDRIHRRGQDRDVEYVALLCDGTIEWPEYARLHRKAAMQADLLGDPRPNSLTRELVLDELLASLDVLGGSS
jgi:SNF2 family DNA or RNA helicase